MSKMSGLYYAQTDWMGSCCTKRDCCIELAAKGPLDILDVEIDLCEVVAEGFSGEQIAWASAQVTDLPAESCGIILVDADIIRPDMDQVDEQAAQIIAGSEHLKIARIARDGRQSKVMVRTAGGTPGMTYKFDLVIQSCDGHQWASCFSQYIKDC